MQSPRNTAAPSGSRAARLANLRSFGWGSSQTSSSAPTVNSTVASSTAKGLISTSTGSSTRPVSVEIPVKRPSFGMSTPSRPLPCRCRAHRDLRSLGGADGVEWSEKVLGEGYPFGRHSLRLILEGTTACPHVSGRDGCSALGTLLGAASDKEQRNQQRSDDP